MGKKNNLPILVVLFRRNEMKKLLILALLLTLSLLLFAEQYVINANQNEVNLISSGADQTVLEMTLGHFNREAVRIDDEMYWLLDLKQEGITLQAGMPQLPYVTRSLIIPGAAKMSVSVLESEYIDIVMPVAPSKGNLTRDINPDDVPWFFDSFYQSSGAYPEELARLSEPFIIRDYRGITVHFQPFVYYPENQTLRVYTRLRLEVDIVGIDNVNVMTAAKNSASSWFENIYKGLFLNYGQAKYPVLDEQGRILIIKNSMFDATLQPYIDWKRQKGFTVDVVDVTVAGPTATQMKTYILNEYNLNTDLAFVQIIGDHAQVPSLTSGGGASDPSFSLLVGNDNYPEIFVGRFSAQTLPELETQISRSIHYERDLQVDNTWLKNAMGIGSSQGAGIGDEGESDIQHLNNIRTDLLNYGYITVDQIYDPTATAAAVSAGLNTGRGFVNYTGHGSNTSWSTTGFSNTNVNALTNDYKLPFIVSVACVNGNFTSITCFAEAWMRATNNVTSAPTGALMIYASSINQSWAPPMRAQDEITDLMVAHQMNTIGGLMFNGSSKMTEVYGSGGADMFKTWHIFGDASLMVRTTTPEPLTAQYMDVLFLGMNFFTVQTVPGAWITLSSAGQIYGTGYADALGSATIDLVNIPTQPMDLTLTITAFNKVTHIGTVQVLPSQGAYILIDDYFVTDDNNNQADFGETVNFDLTLHNLGTAAGQNIIATISSTDQYITILDDTAEFGNIEASSTMTSTNGFTIQIANNVPDQHVAILNVAITQSDTLAWEYNINFVMNAPAFTVEAIIIDDSDGNNNGRIDAGETFVLTIPVLNSGHATASNLLFSMLVTDPLNHIMVPLQNTFTQLEPGATANIIYEVTFSYQVPTGSLVHFMLIGVSGEYTLTYTFENYVGLVMETFDNGNFASFPWTFSGGNWILDYATYHSPGASARSATITHNGSTSMQVMMDVPVQGNITFWKRVSSEQNYDYLKFYVNNTLVNQWSGEVAWSQESYPVVPGPAIFKWEYTKDYMVNAGSDCAWIDDINFPSTGGTTGAPVLAVSETELDFGAHIAADFIPLPFTISNNGDATMIGTVSGNGIFQIAPAFTENYHPSASYVIPAGLSMNFQVKIFPPMEGTFSTDIMIMSDDPDNPLASIYVTAEVLPTSAEDNVTALVTALKGIYPNPFNPETNISFSLKQDGKVTLDIYNVLGQKVRTLVDTNLKAGNHTIRWDGKDSNNRGVSSGIYFLKMQAGSYGKTSKMVLMK